MYNDEGEKISGRYTVSYRGPLFEGDPEDPGAWNSFDTDVWGEITVYMHMYPQQVYINDNYYDVAWHDGEWY